MRILYTGILVCLANFVFSQKNASVSFEKWVSLKSSNSPVISPDGKTIVYTVTSTDWAANSYDSEIWMYKEGGEPFQLTRTNKSSSTAVQFSPDGRFVSFLADRGEKTQLHVIQVNGGEAIQISKEEEGVSAYKWSPDGLQIAITKTEADTKRDKTIKERYGSFGVEGEEYKQTHLWILNFNQDSVKIQASKRLTEGNFNVSGFDWSPDGKSIVFNRQKDPLINSGISADIVMINTSDKKSTSLVANPAADGFIRWNPEGTEFVYNSTVTDSVSQFYKNNRLFIYDMASRKSREIATDIDENKNVIDWNAKGLFILALERTKQKLYTVDTKTGTSKPVSLPLDLVAALSFSKNSDAIALLGRNYEGLSDVYLWRMNGPVKLISNNAAQISSWNTPVNEVIQWKSKDGASIEGVLLKPRNFDPAKKYPLLVVIHGGPTAIDFPEPLPTNVYPVMQWIEKGAVVLRVNYRGSAGYGEKFRSLNVRNLGVGDMWDVVSGVEFLNSKGFIDTSRMGSMGWSQGGYISAFLTTNTNMFKAISVGAGISNWVTYYVSTDITPFTQQYLKATPWSDMDIYLKTSPMTNISKASTPTLIQHGEFDKRVPISNAYELYRGLQDRGIPSKLVVYKGFGHGINKPKERLAAIWHNWQWFNKYIFGEEEALPVD
ncbi:alpha/beta hydrolase family protein [Sediminibacterium salmoneum]|uniref:alpha/beta hydrolase family protein n=1 Tax=Sediminibacterium salmoneum TaxID=426421 RepID=UPI00047EABAD|nr:S9 family peptidase [Sediminibacterium salmoneum]